MNGSDAIHDLGTILGVWAHPDDETYLSAGVIAEAVDNGQRVVVVSATAGERGTEDPVAWPPERLASVRRWEAAAAMAVLGVDDHRWLGLRDGTLAAHRPEDGAERVAKVIVDVDPDTILTFGPDGVTGHPDHRTISSWVTDANRSCGGRARVLHAAESDVHRQRFAAIYERFDLVIDDGGLPPTTPTSRLAVDLELSGPALDRKLVALRAMATQTSPLITLLGADEYEAWVAQESFVDADPARRVSRGDRGRWR